MPATLKINFFILFLLIGQFCRANMSSPIQEGTLTSTAFSSKDINILSEKINIKIDKEFKTVKFIIEYTIQSDVIGRQIPLLFYAQDYKDSFMVWVDNQRVAIQNIPDKYTHFDNSPFSGFSGVIHGNDNKNESDEVSIHWNKNSGYVLSLIHI